MCSSLTAVLFVKSDSNELLVMFSAALVETVWNAGLYMTCLMSPVALQEVVSEKVTPEGVTRFVFLWTFELENMESERHSQSRDDII